MRVIHSALASGRENNNGVGSLGTTALREYMILHQEDGLCGRRLVEVLFSSNKRIGGAL